MAFLKAFDEIVKQRFRQDPNLRKNWEAFEHLRGKAAKDELQRRCGRGRGPFTTDEAVLWYAMAYMCMHFAALYSVLAPIRSAFAPGSRLGIVDFGCGPLTAALAVAELYKVATGAIPEVSYLGIDSSSAMLRIAEQFSTRSDCFEQAPPSRFQFATAASAVNDDRLRECLSGTSCCLLLFSYILGQNLKQSDVPAFADVVCRAKAIANASPVWLTYTNAARTKRDNLAVLANLCRQRGVEFDASSRRKRTFPGKRPTLASDGLVKVGQKPDNLEYLVTLL